MCKLFEEDAEAHKYEMEKKVKKDEEIKVLKQECTKKEDNRMKDEDCSSEEST